jgi:hypothetical protein
MTKLEHRLDSLRHRRTDTASGAVFLREQRLAKALLPAGAREALEYITESAEPVPTDYTTKTFDECDRVQAQLARAFENAGLPVIFDHQGSVTNNTHIRLHSDIDLLTVTDKYFTLEPPLKPSTPYTGNPIADLLALRATATEALRRNYPTADVDASGSRCVSISGGSLARKVDVVACNWLHTEAYVRTQAKSLLGIQVLDTNGPSRVANFPFLHNARLAERDDAIGGKLRRCIRIAKCVRYDSETKIDFSSYDIASLCHAIPVDMLIGQNDVGLTIGFARFAIDVLKDSAKREALMVPNGTRPIFGGAEGASPSGLGALVDEMAQLLSTALPRAA